MTSRINAKQLPRKAPPSGSQKSSVNPHAPSVPISLYREVATELKATKAKIETLTLQNQQLTQQNQQLRVEIERVVQSALQLRQVADAHTPATKQPTDASTPLQGLELHFQNPPLPNTPTAASDAISSEKPEPKPTSRALFTEQEARPRPAQTERAAGMNGWWLAIVICMIIVTAFGTGFLIVRPLLPSR